MNDNNNKIIREEFARAVMIKKANSVLSESAFRAFISEMRKYEENMIIAENMSSENIYDGFQKQLQEQTAEVGKEGEIISNQIGKGEGNITADAEKEPPTGGGNKGDKDPKKSGGTKKFPQTLSNSGQIELKKLNMSDPVKMAQYIMKNTDRFETGDQIEAEQYIKFQKEKLGGGDAPEEPTGDVKKDTQNLGKELESPKAKGILSSIFDSYKFAFASNAKMWEKIYDFINGVGNKPPAEQEKAAQQAKDNLEDNVESDQEAGRSEEDPEGGEEGGDETVNVRKGKNSLQSRLSKLFPDLAKARGTYYYRKTDKQGDQGKIVSKNTSALAAILGDIEAQLKGSGIEISESLRSQLVDTVGTIMLSESGGVLLEKRSDLAKFKTNLQVALQKVTKKHEDPKKKRKAIQKFLFRLKNYAEKGDFGTLASRYEDITAVKKMNSLYDGMKPEEKESSKDYALAYSKKQFTAAGEGRFKSSTLDDAKKDSPTKSKEQMIKMIPKIKNGVLNISQIIGPKLKAAGYDLKSPEGQKVQQRLLKVLRRFLKKDLERLGLSSKVKLLAMFSKSKPKKGKGKVNESASVLEESYLDFFSNYMLEGIINELSN